MNHDFNSVRWTPVARESVVPLAFLLSIIFCTAGCKNESPRVKPSAAEQFKVIADEKEVRLKDLMASKGSELSGYQGTVSDETDIQKKIDYPYLGTITFDYALSKPTGDVAARLTGSAKALYRYSKKNESWEYQECIDETKGGNKILVPPEQQLVKFREVQAVFQKP